MNALEHSSDDHDIGPAGFTHRLVADTKPLPLASGAVNSVFALGGATVLEETGFAPPPEAGEKPAKPDGSQRMAKGELGALVFDALLDKPTQSAFDVATKLGLPRPDCYTALKRLVNAGRAVTSIDTEGRRVFSAQSQSGFKTWLKKKGEPSAEGRAKASATPKSPKPSKAPTLKLQRNAAVPAAPAAPAPQLGVDLVGMLMSTGQVVLMVDAQSLRMDGRQARQALQWLTRIDAALQA